MSKSYHSLIDYIMIDMMHNNYVILRFHVCAKRLNQMHDRFKKNCKHFSIQFKQIVQYFLELLNFNVS